MNGPSTIPDLDRKITRANLNARDKRVKSPTTKHRNLVAAELLKAVKRKLEQ